MIDMVVGGHKGERLEVQKPIWNIIIHEPHLQVFRIEFGNLHNALSSQHPEDFLVLTHMKKMEHTINTQNGTPNRSQHS